MRLNLAFLVLFFAGVAPAQEDGQDLARLVAPAMSWEEREDAPAALSARTEEAYLG